MRPCLVETPNFEAQFSSISECPFRYDVVNRCSGEWLKYSHSIEQRFVLAEIMQFVCFLTSNVSGDSTEARSQFVEAGTATGMQLMIIEVSDQPTIFETFYRDIQEKRC